MQKFPIKNNVTQVEGSLGLCENELDPLTHIQLFLPCDRQTDGHRFIAKFVLA